MRNNFFDVMVCSFVTILSVNAFSDEPQFIYAGIENMTPAQVNILIDKLQQAGKVLIDPASGAIMPIENKIRPGIFDQLEDKGIILQKEVEEHSDCITS